MLRLLTFCISLLLSQMGWSANMNGKPGQYKIMNPNPYSKKQYSTDYNLESFDVYSPPIRSRYSEVYWTMMDDVPLPAEIVTRFQNKTMAIRGFEVDQVMRTSQGDVSVPITWAYNHHFMAFLNSEHVKMTEVIADPEAVRLGHNHGAPTYWKAATLDSTPTSKADIPVSQVFSEANGGEMRLSYHGYPEGFAQLLESPKTFRINPMQIDTKNRNHSGPGFKAGPLPRAALSPPGASYSGLLECPCSTRLKKEFHYSYATQLGGSCSKMPRNASECFKAAQAVTGTTECATHTVADGTLPAGCSVTVHPNHSAAVHWNTAGTPHCGESKASLRLLGSATSVVNFSVDLAVQSAKATLTISGPADVWFGVGLGAQSMCLEPEADECPGGGPYAIVVAGERLNAVTEHKLGFHSSGRKLQRSIDVISNTVVSGTRTVVLKRGFAGLTDDHYSFNTSSFQIPFISATGWGLTFEGHKSKAATILNLLQADSATCICQTGVHGTIDGVPLRGDQRCAHEPTSDLLKQHNPTCSIETYSGGLSCCRHGKFILDADQEVPKSVLEYHLKFRFYFEEYAAGPKPSHMNLVRLYWQTESFAGEYDITPCPADTPPEDCIQEITSRWHVRDMLHDCALRKNTWPCTGAGSTDPAKTAGIQLIYAAPHCHAPSCISMELYNADTGNLLCRVKPIIGESDKVFDEKGYLALPPCMWGDPSEGLLKPVTLSLDTELLAIKRNNNTIGHLGEMASWQMRGIVIPQGNAEDLFV